MPPVPNASQKHDRFAVYNRDLAKNPAQTTDYPRMLTSPTDGTTTIVQDATEHKLLVGAKRFETEPLWGPSESTKARDSSPETTQVDGVAASHAPNEVNIPESARGRKELKLKNLEGKTAQINELVPPQTTFDAALPDAGQTLKNAALGGRPEFKGS